MIKKLSLLLFSLFLLCSHLLAQTKPYVILVSFDGFRWDYVSRGVSPNLDRIKQDGVWAMSLQPDFPSKTFPNHYSIVTGMYPENQGLIANTFYDPHTGETYKISDSTQVRNGKWYLGEAFWQTADRNGIITASYFWPGSEIHPSYRRPDYFKHYVHSRPFEDRVSGVIDWMKLPYARRPRFITLYFEATDDAGHRYGPDSKQVNKAISKEDAMIGLLNKKLKAIGLADSTDVIIVSDHGMTQISNKRVINIQHILKNYDVMYQENGPFMLIEPKDKDVTAVYQTLQKNRKHFKVFTKDNIPASYHYSKNPFISRIILIADLGWSLVDNKSAARYEKIKVGGNHGYDNHEMDMNGVFMAYGPDFKKGSHTGTVRNIDIYPLLCKLFNIPGRSNIDGKLSNIEYVLKGY